jgi:hypothetical protein
MPKADGTPRKKPGRWRIISRVFTRTREPGWHWFDHPEMQARIAEAEAERREGRVKRFDNRDEAIAYLDSL